MVITMKKVYVNEDWCLGCHLCEFTCAAANSGAPDMIKAFAGGKKPVARIQIEEGDKKKLAKVFFLGGLLLFISCYLEVLLFSDPNADPNGSG